jgi:methionine-rich copper-binding protein CopC/putative copper export protein
MFEQFRRVVIVAAFFLGGLFVFVPLAASAHTKFLGSTPASGVELQRAPDVVTLRFQEDAQIDLMRVTDAHGVNRASAAYHPGGETRLVEVKTPALARGSYIVTWQVTADDGHVGEGRFAFGVGVPAAVLPAGGEPGIAGSGMIVALLRFALLAGIVIGTGLAFGALLTVRAPNVAPVSMLEFAAWIVVAFIAFVDIRVQSLITGGSLVTTLNTRYGVLHLTLTIAAFLGAIAVSGGKRHWELLITAIIAVLLSESLGGHGGTGVLPVVGVTFDLAHLLAAAAWIGVLLTALMATEIVDVRRTSNVATYAVILLLVSSVVQVLRNVIPLSGLLTSAYGWEICAKIVLFALAGAIALQSRRRVNDGAVAVASSVRYEMLILTVVVAVTAVLVDGQPPR